VKAAEGAGEAQATRSLLPYQQVAAKEFADRLGARRRKAGAPVRTIFVSDERVERPPLARLLSGAEGGGGGRGGQLRAKLYLSLLWDLREAAVRRRATSPRLGGSARSP
jgi:hypothetical protein